MAMKMLYIIILLLSNSVFNFVLAVLYSAAPQDFTMFIFLLFSLVNGSVAGIWIVNRITAPHVHRFDNLNVSAPPTINSGSNQSLWLYRCDCGMYKWEPASNGYTQ